MRLLRQPLQETGTSMCMCVWEGRQVIGCVCVCVCVWEGGQVIGCVCVVEVCREGEGINVVCI